MSPATPSSVRYEQQDEAGSSSEQELSIHTDDLRLTYADGTEAVRNVSMSVPRGEFFGFLGPNGAGKTTMIKMLATLLRPTGGSAVVNGYDVTSNPTAVRGTIGYMPQEISVDEELTARENLQFACEAYGIPRADRADRIAELLTLIDLKDVADTPAEQFSGGMKKRLDAATALVHDPELVFLDEPTTGLDPKTRNRLWEYFERINDEGTTIFLTTQYLEEADALCDRLAVIRDGTIVEDDSPEELKHRIGGELLEITVDGGPDNVTAAAEIVQNSDHFESDTTVETTDESIRLTATNAREEATDLLVTLREAGITVRGFDVEVLTLDDVFLAIANDEVNDENRSGEGVDQ